MAPTPRTPLAWIGAHLRGKSGVALSSVLAAVLLTGMKLAAGLLTGSLGILAEAAHSALDLIAALMTLFAVRIADREADATHPYGHGRFENLSALLETGLLLATCLWVIWEAVDQILTGRHKVEVSIWAIAVMVVSIAVDFSRSRALSRAAAEHGSQALEADALHFSTDVWSSSVVILGLVLVWIGQRVDDGGLLARADAAAALVVAAIVIWVSLRLGRQTVDALVDTAPVGLADRVRDRAIGVEGVLDADRVRMRRAGNKHFVDLVIQVARTSTFDDAHAVADRVEDAVRGELPNSDVVVHVEPVASPSESAVDAAHFVARQKGVQVHDVRVRQVDNRLEVDMHVELDPRLTIGDAHAAATELERALMAANRRVDAVNTHLEAPGSLVERDQEVTATAGRLIRRVREIADRLAGAGATHEVRVYRSGDLSNLVVHASFEADLSLDRVHLLSAEIERALRAELDDIGTILVHAEPSGDADPP